jgi:deferrochelatase/peroxidase EfeB
VTTSCVQTLVLRNPHGPAVAHLILRVPCNPALFDVAMDRLKTLRPSFGPQDGAACLSIGFSFEGLVRLGMPDAYLRLVHALSPAFADGAVLRSLRMGDSGPSAAPNWQDGFRHEQAHVLVTWHGVTGDGAARDGDVEDVYVAAKVFAEKWRRALQKAPDNSEVAVQIDGHRLGAPPQEQGEWVHYGYRDGLTEVRIQGEQPPPNAHELDLREHRAGELLLGEINDAGFNSFSLSQAPDKVRAFFSDSTFGILRKMGQDVKGFENWINTWAEKLSYVYGRRVPPAFVKAKLCGRWPNGKQVMPGDIDKPSGELALKLDGDRLGEGCPFGSHIRRMRAPPDPDGYVFNRPLQRRSVPFGTAAWNGEPTDGLPRGLLGHFFCASIENQFEHLLGQWAARAPVGFGADDRAADPMIGEHAEDNAAMLMPWKGQLTQRLDGFQSWTTTLGTMYAWYPAKTGLDALLASDFVPDDPGGPWL